MQTRIFAILFLVSLLVVAADGGAQRSPSDEKPVWTMESIKVKPEMFALTLGYLDDHWMRVREDAKRQGAVLSYHRIVEQDNRGSERNIVLLTEYKNQAAYDASRERLFASTRKQSSNNFTIGGVGGSAQSEEFYETANTRVFQDYPEISNVRLRPPAAD